VLFFGDGRFSLWSRFFEVVRSQSDCVAEGA
jgi:hypothetical protein